MVPGGGTSLRRGAWPIAVAASLALSCRGKPPPARTEIVRKVGPNHEVFVRVNLDRIFSGDDPDIFLKPDDLINVGTTGWAPFVAAIRGAFRFTYGFGFLYDRNFG